MESLLKIYCHKGHVCSQIYNIILQSPPFTTSINEKIINYIMINRNHKNYGNDKCWDFDKIDNDLKLNAICKILYTGTIKTSLVKQVIDIFITSNIDAKNIIPCCKLYKICPAILLDFYYRQEIPMQLRVHILENCIEYIENKDLKSYLRSESITKNVEINKLISQMLIKNDEIQSEIKISNLEHLIKFLPSTKDIVDVFLYSIELDENIINYACLKATAEGLEYLLKTVPTKENYKNVLLTDIYSYRYKTVSNGRKDLHKKIKLLLTLGYKLDIDSINIALEHSIELPWDIVVDAGLDKEIGIEQMKICESRSFLPKVYKFNGVDNGECLEVLCKRKQIREIEKFLKTHNIIPSYKSIENACSIQNNYRTIKTLINYGGDITFDHILIYSKTISSDMHDVLLLYKEKDTKVEKVMITLPDNPNTIQKKKSHEVPDKVRMYFGEKIPDQKLTYLALKRKILRCMKEYSNPPNFILPYELIELLEIPNKGEDKVYMIAMEDIDKLIELFYV